MLHTMMDAYEKDAELWRRLAEAKWGHCAVDLRAGRHTDWFAFCRHRICLRDIRLATALLRCAMPQIGYCSFALCHACEPDLPIILRFSATLDPHAAESHVIQHASDYSYNVSDPLTS